MQAVSDHKFADQGRLPSKHPCLGIYSLILPLPIANAGPGCTFPAGCQYDLPCSTHSFPVPHSPNQELPPPPNVHSQVSQPTSCWQWWYSTPVLSGRSHAKELEATSAQLQTNSSKYTGTPMTVTVHVTSAVCGGGGIPARSQMSSALPPSRKHAIVECPNPCYVDPSGTVHECRVITCAMEHQRRLALVIYSYSLHESSFNASRLTIWGRNMFLLVL